MPESYGLMNKSVSIDETASYAIEIEIAPNPSAVFGLGLYSIHFVMDNTTPVLSSSVEVRCDITNATTGACTVTVHEDNGVAVATSGSSGPGTARPFVLRALVETTPRVTVYVDGGAEITNQSFSANAGDTAVGLSMTPDEDIVARIRAFRVYATPSPAFTGAETKKLAISNGALYDEDLGAMSTVSSATHAYATDRRVRMVQYNQKMYIIDNDESIAAATDGAVTSTTNFDSATYSAWVTTGVISTKHVLIIDEAGTGVALGSHPIASVAQGAITLSTATTNGTGATFRVVPHYMVYDGKAGTQAKWTATTDKGFIPYQCSLVEVWAGRIVLAGDYTSPSQWYMSKVNDPDDWDYGDEAVGAAVSGANAKAGIPGQPISAIFAVGDDYLVMASRTQLWVMRGDPTSGGRLDELSRDYGVISGDAWCRGDGDELYFLSEAGMYVIAGPTSKPQSLSYEKLPKRLRGLGPDVSANLAYDVMNRGVHIFLISKSGGKGAFDHWWWDKQTGGWFPVVLGQTNHEPTSIHALRGDVILGNRDGYMRRFRNDSPTDDGTSISSYFDIGPLALGGQEGRLEGVLMKLMGTIGQDSGSATATVYVGNTPDTISTTAFNGTPITYTAGRSSETDVRARGGACVIRVSNVSSSKVAFEALTARIVRKGRLRP